MDVRQVDAAKALLLLSAQAEDELFGRYPARTPLGMVLYRSRRDAIQALSDLVKIPFNEADAIRVLQNEVVRYLDMLKFVRETLTAGEEAADELAPQETEELRIALGLSAGADDE
jgi:hypothetical protein